MARCTCFPVVLNTGFVALLIWNFGNITLGKVLLRLRRGHHGNELEQL